MRIIENRAEFHIADRTAAAIGKFDGVHKGHQKLLSYITEQKKHGLKAAVLTFFPSPLAFFSSGEKTAVLELTTREEKRRLFKSMGVDLLIEFPFNCDTAAMEPEIFIKKVLGEQMQAAYIAAGEDLSFGAGGRGDKRLLEKMSAKYGYRTEFIPKLHCGLQEISSSSVRQALKEGQMEKAEELLGRPYSILGCVEQGKKLGRRWGMPTVNLYPSRDKLLPPNGVYYARIIQGKNIHAGITNIGCKPTVNNTEKISVETYLYNFQGDLYGEEIVTELLRFRRPERKFSDVRALQKQMEADIRAGELFHKEWREKI